MYRPFLLSLLPKCYGMGIVSIVFALHLITQRWPHLCIYYAILFKGCWAPVNFSEWSWNRNPDIPRVTVCISNAWVSQVLFFSPWFLEKQTKHVFVRKHGCRARGGSAVEHLLLFQGTWLWFPWLILGLFTTTSNSSSKELIDARF